jgi:hypothetical protein
VFVFVAEVLDLVHSQSMNRHQDRPSLCVQRIQWVVLP